MMENKEFWKPMENTVELDETLVGGKEKNKHKHKKIKGAQGRSSKGKTIIFGMLERGNDLRLEVVPDVKKKTLRAIIDENVKERAEMMTDEWKGYNGLSADYIHQRINHSKKIYADGDIHVNTIEGFWSLLKRGIYGIYHKASQKHIHRYCSEFAFRYKTREITESDRFNLTLSQCNGRLMYRELTDRERKY